MLRWRQTNTRRIWRERGLGLGRAWRRPELVARPVQSSIVSKAGKNLAVTAITMAVKLGSERLWQKVFGEVTRKRAWVSCWVASSLAGRLQ